MTEAVSSAAVAIELRALTHSYGGPPVLANIDLDIGAGRVVALHGPNGAGKTTLLRLLATRLRPTRGQARVRGFDVVSQAHEVRTQIATLSVYGGAYAALTGRENLRLAQALRGEVEADAIDAALHRVGLRRAADHLLRAYSSGMRKRLSLARLLLAEAPVWLLDEPLNGLDREAVTLCEGLVAQHCEAGGIAVIASHQPFALAGVRTLAISDFSA